MKFCASSNLTFCLKRTAGGVALALLFLPVVAATATAQSPSLGDPQVSNRHQPVSGPDVSDYASPSLDPEELAFMQTYLNALPLSLREKIYGQPVNLVSVIIVDGATGAIHYNRVEDVGTYQYHAANQFPNSRPYPLQSPPPPSEKAQTTVRGEVANPGVYGGSGPYRRVYTQPVLPIPHTKENEFAWSGYTIAGRVTTSLKAGKFATGDLGYAYLGGWSGIWNSLPKSLAADSAVDAGLQYNLGASHDSVDDYAAFMNVGGKIISVSTDKADPQPPHILGGGVTDLEFSVVTPIPQLQTAQPACWTGSGNSLQSLSSGPNPACNTFALVLTVTSGHFKNVRGIRTMIIEWIAPSFNDGGWAQTFSFKGYWQGKQNVTRYTSASPCGNCIFKWMTSIAQKKESLHDSSTYSARWTNRKISDYAFKGGPFSPLVPLQPSITDCSEYPLWTPPFSKPYDTDCKITPTGLKGLAQSIAVSAFTATTETDTITLKY